jgi:S-adenosylmethionine/arginine decarboxylase-like enzyme
LLYTIKIRRQRRMKAQMFNHSEWVSETNPFKLRNKYTELLKDSGFGILSFLEYNFEPQGYTALWLLSESHFAIHTFPEENKSYIELSSCIEKQYLKFMDLNDPSLDSEIASIKEDLEALESSN